MHGHTLSSRQFAALILLFVCPAAGAWKAPRRFLFISSPQNGTIGYVRMRSNANFSREEVQILVSDGLHHPQGIAVDQKGQRLIVADPDLGKLISFNLRQSGDSITVHGHAQTIVDGVTPRWVTVDGRGDVFFSEEGNDQILTVPYELQLQHEGSTTSAPHVVYDVAAPVRSPGGLATDNFFLYWVNKELGSSQGLIIKAPQQIGLMQANVTEQPLILSRAVNKGYGVCVTRDMVLFTADSRQVFKVSKDSAATGGADMSQMVTDQMGSPRGCVFDGEDTVYVADRTAGAVYQFPANMVSPQTSLVQSVAFEGAFGLAMMSAGHIQTISYLAVVVVSALLALHIG
mmetsp:Transcript_54332/g.129465  ORF Transcript_54332/g.129465 Transcript_54332/m.129465 type:complete len:345 (-) Transcript_54332:52-1086(-)